MESLGKPPVSLCAEPWGRPNGRPIATISLLKEGRILLLKTYSERQALNKWMSTITGQHYVLHGFRHAFRDRLRAIECPTEIIDQLGGWALPTVGQSYGNGYPLDTLHKWMGKMADASILVSQNGPRKRKPEPKLSTT
jgi:integrase